MPVLAMARIFTVLKHSSHPSILYQIYQASNLSAEQKKVMWSKWIKQATQERIEITEEELQQIVGKYHVMEY